MKEALKLALEALETAWYHVGTFCPTDEAIELYDEARAAIKEALAQPERTWKGQIDNDAFFKSVESQPEQEPVAWESILGAVARGWCYEENANKTMDSDLAVAIAKEVQSLYTTPPQRTWVGLTDEEIWQLVNDCVFGGDLHPDKFALIIEAKLRSKNE